MLQARTKSSFFALRRVCSMQKLSHEMVFNRDRATKQSFLSFWLLEMHEKSRIKEIVARRSYSLVAKAVVGLR